MVTAKHRLDLCYIGLHSRRGQGGGAGLGIFEQVGLYSAGRTALYQSRLSRLTEEAKSRVGLGSWRLNRPVFNWQGMPCFFAYSCNMK